MPITPQQALQKSPAARMTDDERETFDRFKHVIDDLLATQWPGGVWQIQTDACTARTMAYVVRAYQTSGWRMSIAAIDGKLGKAAELIAAGAGVNWQLTFIPDWDRS